MEGKNTAITLPELEREILDRCLFPEAFDMLCEECGQLADVPVIADAIKNLLHLKFLTAINTNTQALHWMYDVDHMRECQFVATSKGLEALRY